MRILVVAFLFASLCHASPGAGSCPLHFLREGSTQSQFEAWAATQMDTTPVTSRLLVGSSPNFYDPQKGNPRRTEFFLLTYDSSTPAICALVDYSVGPGLFCQIDTQKVVPLGEAQAVAPWDMGSVVAIHDYRIQRFVFNQGWHTTVLPGRVPPNLQAELVNETPIGIARSGDMRFSILTENWIREFDLDHGILINSVSVPGKQFISPKGHTNEIENTERLLMCRNEHCWIECRVRNTATSQVYRAAVLYSFAKAAPVQAVTLLDPISLMPVWMDPANMLYTGAKGFFSIPPVLETFSPQSSNPIPGLPVPPGMNGYIFRHPDPLGLSIPALASIPAQFGSVATAPKKPKTVLESKWEAIFGGEIPNEIFPTQLRTFAQSVQNGEAMLTGFLNTSNDSYGLIWRYQKFEIDDLTRKMPKAVFEKVFKDLI